MSGAVVLEREVARFKELTRDPLSSCSHLTRAAQRVTAADYCRLDVFTRSALVSVTFEDTPGGSQTHHLSTRSCAAHWLSVAKDLYHFVEHNATFMGQPLPDEWQRYRHCASFLSFRMCVPHSAQQIWGTLTLAARAPSHFREGPIRDALRLMDAFLRTTNTTFLTDVCQKIYELEQSRSIKASMNVLNAFYLSHAPLLSVSVAVRGGSTDKTSLFIGERPTKLGENPTLKHLTLRMDENALMSRIQATGESHPVSVKVLSTVEDPGQNFESDLKQILPAHRTTSAFFWGLPLKKPVTSVLGGSLSPFSLPSNSHDDGFVGVVYLRVRNAQALREMGHQLHSLSPIFASILSRTLPSMKEELDLVFVQDIPSPLRNVESHIAGTEMTERIKKIIQAMYQNKSEEWQSGTSPLKSLCIEAVLSDQSSFGIILKGTFKERVVGIKLLSARKAERSADHFRPRLELAICHCVSHPNVVRSCAQQINVSGTQLLQCCPPCTCQSEGKCECQRHQVMDHLVKKAHPYPLQCSPWDIVVMEYCDGGTLHSMIHRSKPLPTVDSPLMTPPSGHVFWDSVDRCELDVQALLETLLEMAEALEYLHENGIVHGDFKPENVLVETQLMSSTDSRGWMVKVADFGTSRVLGYDPTRRPPEGTWAYKPPEQMGIGSRQAKCHADGVAGDVYSFGMTFWEMMEAKRPFENFKDSFELQRKVTQEHYRPQLTVPCPSDCKALLEQCWHQSPKQRPVFHNIVQTVKNMMTSLSH